MGDFYNWVTAKVDELEADVKSLIRENAELRVHYKRIVDRHERMLKALKKKANFSELGNISINTIYKDDTLYEEFLEYFGMKEGGADDDI